MKCRLCFKKGHIRRNCPQNKGKHRAHHIDTTSDWEGGIEENLSNLDFASMNHIKVVETCNCDTDDKSEIMTCDLDSKMVKSILHDSSQHNSSELHVSPVQHTHSNNSMLSISHEMHESPVSHELYNSDIFTINYSLVDSRPIIPVILNGKLVRMEFDSGSTVSVCSRNVLVRSGCVVKFLSTSKCLKVANGEEMPAGARALVDVEFNGQVIKQLELFIVDGQFPALFGRSWITRFLGEDWLSKLLKMKPDGVTDKPMIGVVTDCGSLNDKCVGVVEESDYSDLGPPKEIVKELDTSVVKDFREVPKDPGDTLFLCPICQSVSCVDCLCRDSLCDSLCVPCPVNVQSFSPVSTLDVNTAASVKDPRTITVQDGKCIDDIKYILQKVRILLGGCLTVKNLKLFRNYS